MTSSTSFRLLRHFLSLLALSLPLLPLSAHAHRTWLLPSTTVLSGSNSWITVDAAVSNDLFYFEHSPLRLDGLQVRAPDGTDIKPENIVSGKYRSSFDVHLTQGDGTYKMAVLSQSMFATYQDANGQSKRWRGTAETLSREIPADARALEVSQVQGRVESFVTVGKPSRKALEISGAGLELQFLTHPTDLLAGDTATFRLLLDGKPAANLNVEVVPGGARYRDQLNALALRTDADGQFSVRWPQPGMYWIAASLQDDKTSVAAARVRRVSYSATLEVLPP